ncbi:MAG TPA: hypothetical protein VIL18_14200 [Longimicrobiales bacterium]
MYAEGPEPIEYHEIPDEEIVTLPEDRVAALSDALLTALLDDLHERAAGLAPQRAALLEPVIAALELEAIRRGIARPAVTEPTMRAPALRRLKRAAAAGDLAAFDAAMRDLDAAALFRAYLLALEWPDVEGRASALSRVAWNLNERVYGLYAAMTHAKHVAWSRAFGRIGPEEQAARHRQSIDDTFTALIHAGEMERLRRR